MNTSITYNGNALVKRDGVEMAFTQEEVVEYAKCASDPVYFISKYVKIVSLDRGLVSFELYDYQKKMIACCADNRFTIAKLPRQAGKSVTFCAYLLHFAVFNAEKTVAILANKGATAREMLSRITRMLENLPFFLQPGCKVLNKGNIVFSNGSEILAASTSSSSIRGLSINCVAGDTFVACQLKSGETKIDEISKFVDDEIEVTKILTERGFKKFSGFITHEANEQLIQLTIPHVPRPLKCTPDHKIMMADRTWKTAKEIQVGDEIFVPELKNIKVISKSTVSAEKTYDALEVKGTHSYWTSGFISHNCLFLDEFAFVQNSEEFYTSTYPVISSGKDTKVIITSTPNGVNNMFYKLWDKAKKKESSFKCFEASWRDVPGRDEKWKLETIGNTSPEQFRQEYECEFIGSSNTLINTSALLCISPNRPIDNKYDINIYEEPIEGHEYVMTVDVSKGRGMDYSTFMIIDVTSAPFKQVAVYRNNSISPMLYPSVIIRGAKMYNDALVIVENNDVGAIVCNALYYDEEYDNMFVTSVVKSNGIGVVMSSKVKRIGCYNLKDLIEAGKIIINDHETLVELTAFGPKGNSYEGLDGVHDDVRGG